MKMTSTKLRDCFSITMISFILQALTCGHSFSSGIYLLQLKTFSQYRSSLWWIGSLNTGLMFGAGPLVNLVLSQIGSRFTIILGGILSSLGLFLASFSTTVIHLYLTYGLLTGLGFSLVYIPSVVAVAEHSDQYIKITVPISSAGVGAGCLVFAPLLTAIIGEYADYFY